MVVRRRFSRRPIYGNVLSTGRCERLLEPSAPAMLQPKSGESSHQVQFGRPAIAKLDGVEADAVLGEDHVLCDDSLLHWVVQGGVNADRFYVHIRRLNPLTTVKPRQIGHERFDDERALRFEVLGNTVKTVQLIILTKEGEQRIEGDEDQRKTTIDNQIPEVAHGHRDVVSTRLTTQLGDHRWRGVDSLDVDSPL